MCLRSLSLLFFLLSLISIRQIHQITFYPTAFERFSRQRMYHCFPSSPYVHIYQFILTHDFISAPLLTWSYVPPTGVYGMILLLSSQELEFGFFSIEFGLALSHSWNQRISWKLCCMTSHIKSIYDSQLIFPDSVSLIHQARNAMGQCSSWHLCLNSTS